MTGCFRRGEEIRSLTAARGATGRRQREQTRAVVLDSMALATVAAAIVIGVGLCSSI